MANPGNLVPHKFKPGQSGNPGGRPKGLMEYVRKQTKDGHEIIAIVLRILRGQKSPPEHKIQAARELLNRGWGRVPDSEGADVRTVIFTVNDPRDLPVPNGGDRRRGNVAPPAAAPASPGLRAPAPLLVQNPRGRWMTPEELDAEADAATTHAGGRARTMGPRSFGPPE